MTTLHLVIMCGIQCIAQETLSSYRVSFPVSDQQGMGVKMVALSSGFSIIFSSPQKAKELSVQSIHLLIVF